MRYLSVIVLLLPLLLTGQKAIYIPNEWQLPGGLDYSFDRSAESENFIVFWGPLAGDDPTQAPPNIVFDPQQIVDTAEELYSFYIDSIKFIQDEAGLISQYKIILVMLHTWTGVEGWAFGGNYDGVVGAMWMHPHAASSGPTLAHEFTHALQNYTWMMNPGHGFIDSSYVGFFWETHAEFMSLQKYPSVALDFDMARWLNTCQYHWSSTRHHYQAFVFLQYIKERDGIEMINRMWNESNIGEHPLETYKRLKGIDQDSLNHVFADYAMHNVVWDYAIGDLLRTRVSTIESRFLSHPTFIPGMQEGEEGWFKIQEHLAPQDYGYNIIRLYPTQSPDCSDRVIHLKLAGHTNWPAAGEGWRFGMVAVKNGHEARYSGIYSNRDEIVFPLHTDETELYLVVTGAPSIHHNYAWEIGFPKIYRYPYDFRLENAMPEGFQPGFRSPPEGIQGAPHANGGGFVAFTATAEPTAYVGPEAQVLDNAAVRGFARIEGNAIIQDNAWIDGNATVSGNAIIGENAHIYEHALVTDQAHVFAGCEVYGNAVLQDNALIFFTSAYNDAVLSENTFCWGAHLHGDVILGGDAEFFIECDQGTYYQFQGAYGRQCDGLDDHPANDDVNPNFGDLYSSDLSFVYNFYCNSVYEEIYDYICEGDSYDFNGTLINESGTYTDTLTSVLGIDSIVTLDLTVEFPIGVQLTGILCPGDTAWFMDFSFLPGVLYDTILDDGFCGIHITGMLGTYPVDTTLLVLGHSLEVQQPSYFIEWYDCETGLAIAGAFGSTYTPVESGYYKAKMITLDTCEAFTECQYVIGTWSESPDQPIHFNFHPNPSKDYIVLTIGLQSPRDIHVKIIDMLGQSLLRQTISLEEDEYQINLAGLSPGPYLIGVEDRNGNFVTKHFVKID